MDKVDMVGLHDGWKQDMDKRYELHVDLFFTAE
jgi:hypothetical protein